MKWFNYLGCSYNRGRKGGLKSSFDKLDIKPKLTHRKMNLQYFVHSIC